MKWMEKTNLMKKTNEWIIQIELKNKLNDKTNWIKKQMKWKKLFEWTEKGIKKQIEWKKINKKNWMNKQMNE